MSMDTTACETIVPSRYVTFTFPNPLPRPLPHLLHTSLLHIAVLDSPSTVAAAAGKVEVAAMLVPPNRQHDWIFSAQTGHLQLLLTFPQLSRLILISNYYNDPVGLLPSASKGQSVTDCENQMDQIQVNLMPLLFALTPKSAFDQNRRFPEIPFLSYEDDVIRSQVLETFYGPCVGEMLVENVELELVTGNDSVREFRRRLRYKRMPNLVQTQVRIHPVVALTAGIELDGLKFRVDSGILVQPYLSPMVACLSLISSCLDKRIHMGFRPRALCLGIGGGALVEFLSSELQFEVVGVEEDEVVLIVANKYFGLNESEMIHLCIGDGIELIQKLAFEDSDADLRDRFKFRNSGGLDHLHGNFDVVMVDLDSSDAILCSSAPPLEFVKKSVLLAAKKVLFEHGVVILNVVPASKSFYDMVTSEFVEVFEDVYEIDVGNGDNMVLVASASASLIGAACADYDNSFLRKLNSSIQGSHMNSLRKISGTSLLKSS
ncbi:OLC1v1026240C1 [Oldenlandia corymbosa var. corymbosa]|uniref:OLC1v1026240C1 n=1 Tax=Oldenlandia corymbosa var. corymbosa TaxID=529605 RepID=A0AAV1C737_OLDCO|nr:OLC1v1026240C1 [Oldenlandia corymbosa var. corymbosa]